MRLLLAALLFGVLAAAPRPAAADPADMCESPPCTKDEIAVYERRVADHMLRVNKNRFEAKYGGHPERARRYERELKRTQARWIEAQQALESAD